MDRDNICYFTMFGASECTAVVLTCPSTLDLMLLSFNIQLQNIYQNSETGQSHAGEFMGYQVLDKH